MYMGMSYIESHLLKNTKYRIGNLGKKNLEIDINSDQENTGPGHRPSIGLGKT